MSNHVNLLGAEQVERAGYVIRDAAASIARSADEMRESVRLMASELRAHRDALESDLGPLQPCQGCRYLVRKDDDMSDAFVLSCRLAPTIKRVDGLGCGSRRT